MKKIILIKTLILICVFSAYGQQEPQYTQFMYNQSIINPAYVGSTETGSFFGLYRTQWLGLEGAPKTAVLSYNQPIVGSNLGYGVSVLNDRIGPSDETQFSIDLSYTIFLKEDSKIAFGIKTSGNLLNIDYSLLNQFNPGEQILGNNVSNRFSPNIGAGFFYYNSKNYLGLSVPMLLDTKKYNDIENSEVNQRFNLYLTGGKVFDLSQLMKFKPAFIAKSVSGSPLQLDLTANFIFNDKFTFGASYRWSASMSLLAGFQVNKSTFIGYGFDRETTRLSNYNSGSHELFLQFDLFRKNSKIESPRFF